MCYIGGFATVLKKELIRHHFVALLTLSTGTEIAVCCQLSFLQLNFLLPEHDNVFMHNWNDTVMVRLVCMQLIHMFHLIHSLNETITTLLVQGNISSSEWQKLSVVVALQPFAVPRSFIVQVCT